MTFAPLLLRTEQPLALHPDRMLPGDPRQRAVARTIYASVQNLPIISMHGHVDAAVFADDPAFADPAQLLIVPDHYVYPDALRAGHAARATRRSAGRRRPHRDRLPDHLAALLRQLELFRGTPSRYWLEHELGTVFGRRPSSPAPTNADDDLRPARRRARRPGFRPPALLDRFDIELTRHHRPGRVPTSPPTPGWPPTGLGRAG